MVISTGTGQDSIDEATEEINVDAEHSNIVYDGGVLEDLDGVDHNWMSAGSFECPSAGAAEDALTLLQNGLNSETANHIAEEVLGTNQQLARYVVNTPAENLMEFKPASVEGVLEACAEKGAGGRGE